MTPEEAANNLHTNIAAIGRAGVTVQEAADGIVALAPAMQAAWDQCMENDALWAVRAKEHGRLRTWLLRWQLRKGHS